MIPTINPWKGLQPYIDSEDDIKLHPFCGRENVVREMFDLIDNNIITTLYGKSGIGKTSLLNAGLFPKLRLEDYIPVYVRLGIDCLENETFAECITRKIVEKTKELDSRVGIEMPMPDSCKVDFLWAFFAKYDFYTRDNSVRYPVVILDQFEEIFNSDPESVKQLLLQLQELTSDKLLPDGNPFDVNFRVAISIREDDLYLLEDAIDSYFIPELKANRYRLKPLCKKEAIRVIEVCDNKNISICRDLFDENQSSDIYDSIIRIATGNDTNGGINTQVLSLCCYLLYNKNKNVQTTIRLNDIEELRGNLLGSFYDEATKDLTEIQRKVFEEHLVTENNRRLAWSKSAFFEAICNSKDNPQKESVFLNGEYAILRYVTTHGEKCVELIHDMLASIVAERKLHRKNRERNLRRRLNKMNVLSPEGRRLIDNALEFDPDVDKLGGDERFFLDFWMKFNNMLSSEIDWRNGGLNITTTTNISLQRAFDDSQLQDATIRLEFINDNDEHVYTSDGIYIIEVKYSDNKIAEILFFNSDDSLTNSDVFTPVYIKGGFCGIRIEYNGELEIKRTYLQWDGESYLPTITSDGYASVEFLDFNKFGNPTRTIYRNERGKRCKHKNGNYGFKSEYDEDGFECRRTFTNELDEPAPILSGVVARDLEYDHETGLLSREVYLNSEFSPMKDVRGYCAAEFKRDMKGRIIEERFFDEQGEPCIGKDGYAIEVNEYHDNVVDNYSITSFLDCDGKAMMHPDGYWNAQINFDTLGYPIRMIYMDNENNPVYLAKDEAQEIQFIYDKRHWLVGFKIIGDKGVHKMGCWLEYNSTFTHIGRMGYLSADNRKTQIPDTDAYALGVHEDFENSSLPLLRVYWDENNRPIEINTGYYSYRLWEEKGVNWFDESDRSIKELFYDLDGNPMADRFGVYGKRYVYDDKLLIKNVINIGLNGEDVNSTNGICRIEMLFDSNGKEICCKFYDKCDNRCLNSEGLSMFRFEWTDDCHTKTSTCYDKEEKISDKELGYAYLIEEMDKVFPSKVHRRYYKNAAQEIVVVDEGFYIAEYLYDKDGNTIEIRNIGPDGNLMKKQDGYAVFRIETIENKEGQTRNVLYLDENRQLVVPEGMSYAMSLKSFDKDGRVTKTRFFDAEENPVMISDGTYGATYEYGLNDNSVIQCNINENGDITSDDNGIAKSLTEFDDKGQKIKEIFYDIKGNARLTEDEDYGKRWRYSDTVDSRTEAIESLNDNEGLMINKWGYAVIERCYDKKNRLLSVSYYDENQQPIKSIDNYHFARHEYNDVFSNKKITYYDTEGKPCENYEGVSQVIQELDSNGRVTSEHRLNQKDEMVLYDATTYIVKKEYVSDNEWIESYLNQKGLLCDNSDGVAYHHLRKDDNGRIVFDMRYNAKGNPQADEWGDFGEETFYDDTQKMRKYIGLDSEGNPHENKLGFVSQIVFQINNVTRRIFLDGNDSPIASIYGEFGQEVEQIDEFTTKTTSIDSELNPMIPNNHGYATEIKTIDDDGRIKRLFWLTHDGSPYVDSDGDSGVEYVYHGDNTRITISLNKQGYPHVNNRGYAEKLEQFDEKGRVILIRWYDVDNNPVVNEDKLYGTHIAYNESENSQIIAYLDKNGKPYKNSEGWTYKKIVSIDNSDTQEIHFYDNDMNPSEDQEGDVAYRREVYEDGSITFVSLDAYGNPHNNKNGYAWRKVILDEKDRVTKELWYDVNGEPFANEQGDYGRVYKYDDDNRATFIVYLNEKGNPHINRSGCSAIRRIKDMHGRVVKEMWLDNDLKPIADSSSGCYGLNIFYLSDNMEIRMNLDESEKFAEDKDGIAYSKIWRDSFGRITKKMNYDISCNPAYDLANYCGEQFIYTDNPNTEIRVYLDSEGNPCITKAGYMREVIISSEKGTKHRLFDDNWKSVSVIGVVIKALYLFLFKKKHKASQNGQEMAVFHVTMDGQLRNCKIDGDFMLIQFNRWEMGFPMEILEQEIENSRDTEKDMVFIRLNMNEDKLSLGDYYHMHFTKELLGAEFENMTIPNDLYQEAIRIVNNHVED